MGPSGSAAATSAPMPCAASASGFVGPITALARQRPGNDTGSRDKTGVVRTSTPEFVVSSTKPRTEGTIDSARASAASPSGENRSGPANRISSARTAGRPSAAAATRSAMRRRGQGQGPKRASAARSISTTTTSGPPPDCRDSSGNSRSSARSRSARRAPPGESVQAVSSTTRRTSPASRGFPSRCRTATDADLRRNSARGNPVGDAFADHDHRCMGAARPGNARHH